MVGKSDGIEHENQHGVKEDIRSPKPKHQRKFHHYCSLSKLRYKKKCTSVSLLNRCVWLVDQEPVTKCGSAGQSLKVQPDNMPECRIAEPRWRANIAEEA